MTKVSSCFFQPTIHDVVGAERLGNASYNTACNMIRLFISPPALYPLGLDSENLGSLGAAMILLHPIMFDSNNTN